MTQRLPQLFPGDMPQPLLAVVVVSLESVSDDFQKQQHLKLQNMTTEWPSLRFYFTLKRSSMKVHGQSDFSMVADPVVSVDGEQILYNVFVTFMESSTVHNYTLFDGDAYYSSSSLDNTTTRPTVTCLEPELGHLPPISTIVAAINRATAITSSSSDTNGFKCSNDNMFKVSVNDIDFALCASGSTGLSCTVAIWTSQWNISRHTRIFRHQH